MSRLVVIPTRPVVLGNIEGSLLAAGSLGLVTLAALLAALAPMELSIGVVFACAGPHNWIEARFVLSRLPARWGKLWPFFLVALGGILGLTVAYVALTVWLQCGRQDPDTGTLALAVWDSVLIGWVLAIIHLRSQQKPKRDWSVAIPVGLLALAGTWLFPGLFGLALVYGHPLLALAILDRELARSRPGWRSGYHACLAWLPVLLGLLWWHLASAPDLPGQDALSVRIQQHAGAGLLRGVSSHVLVATHTFLETVHYGIWLVAIPLIGLESAPWKLAAIPIARRPGPGRAAVAGLLAVGAMAVVVLWGGFLANYALTRDIYFTVALLHVLAEIPFLLRTI
jgi:hypothetical protein